MRDIEPYAAGNCGIPFVWTFASRRPGPHVMVNGLTHGNEPAGMEAVTRLLDEAVRPHAGRLTLTLANVAAYERCRSGGNLDCRFIDRDLNRLWRDDWIDADEASSEAARARALRPILAEVDALLDLHTTAFVSRPFFVLADLAKHRGLADRMHFPPTQQLMPGGCGEGRHLTDYGRFADPESPAVAVAVECGTHGDPQSAEVALQAARRFLGAMGTTPVAEAFAAAPIERFRTVAPCIAQTNCFVLALPATGFVTVRKGQTVARDGDQPVVAPDDLVIVSPRPRPEAGRTAFLWCEPC